MTTISNEKNETLFIYHSDKSDDKKAAGYAASLDGYIFRTWDLKTDPITKTQLAEIATQMNKTIADLIDVSYNKDFGNGESLKEMDEDDILTLVANDPIQLKTPILIIDNQALQCPSSYSLIKEKMNEKGIKSHSTHS